MTNRRGQDNARPRKPSPSPRRVRLMVEELEPRTLLSVLTPAQVRQAYGFNQITFSGGAVQGTGAGQTIAIVDAYNDPNIGGDLAQFDQTFGLAAASLKVVNQSGGSALPATDAGWAVEIALDVEWAHAIAPAAQLLLVETNSANLGDLLTGVNYAKRVPGVVVVSMSWASSEFSFETYLDSSFTTPANHIGGSNLPGGVTFVAASGDNGSGVSYPAASSKVLAVGGTTLNVDGAGNYLSETAWSGSGGGYSAYEAEPVYQNGVQSSGKRANPDVAAVGDPNTGLYVYDTVPYNGYAGWFQVGGTSAGAPVWAALIAIADQGRGLAGKGSLANVPSIIYTLPSSDFHDITSGSNGAYSAGPGYDLVTGRGTPRANLIVAGLLSGPSVGNPIPAPAQPTSPAGTGFPATLNLTVGAAPAPVAALAGSRNETSTMKSGAAAWAGKERGEKELVDALFRRPLPMSAEGREQFLGVVNGPPVHSLAALTQPGEENYSKDETWSFLLWNSAHFPPH